jgi:UDP-2,4-diacetamido-2,4,6-trideoxy-beta-L-altropyranose hydrolase
MKILLRADSSLQIGTGHVSRCLTLAQHLKFAGLDVTFVCRELKGNIISLIEEKQFKVIKLPSPIKKILGDIYEQQREVNLSQEIEEFVDICRKESPDWIIMDHYGLPIEWENSIKELGVKLFIIDDLLREHLCDALLDQNYRPNYNYYDLLIPKNAKRYLGPKYALLDPSFYKISIPFRTFKDVTKVLVFFGGTDSNGETLRLTKAVIDITNINFHIVIGKNNPALQELEKLCTQYSHLKLHVQITNMAELMKECDLFFGAGGTITWERCRLGLPGVCISVAENQIQIAKDLDQADVHWYLGESHLLKDNQYREALLEIIEDKVRLITFKENSLKLEVGVNLKNMLDLFL